MLRNVQLNTHKVGQSVVYEQVRHVSRRRIAYPSYKAQFQNRAVKRKTYKTNLRYQMELFLGKKNYKHEYPQNRYFSPSENHVPKYITPRAERGNPLIDTKTGKPLDANGKPIDASRYGQNSSNLQPFPFNPYCTTEMQLSKADKDEIYRKVIEENIPVQEVALEFGLRIQRIEAVAQLVTIEKRWKNKGLISKDLKKMSGTLYKMFPIFSRGTDSENLTEIPVPKKALQSRFLSIAESEPFGPVDAAEILGIEPAAETLRRLSSLGDHLSVKSTEQDSEHEVVVGKQQGKDRFVYHFKKAKVGEVGFRYGTPLRDNKKDRKVTYDQSGKMIYALRR